MIVEFVQKTVADKIGEGRYKSIGMDYSFVDNHRVSEDDFLEIIETIEEEMAINLIDHIEIFLDVGRLVDYIRRHL